MSVTTATVRDRFSKEARNWDRLYDGAGATSIYQHNLLRRRKTALEFVGSPPGRVLDVGCGPGNVTLELPSTCEVTATDFAVPMLQQTRHSAISSRRPIDLTASDATRLPFADCTMDTVLTLGLLEYIPEPTEVLREIGRVIRTGGTLVVSIPNANSPFVMTDDLIKGAKNLVTRILMPAPLRRVIKQLMGKTDTDYFTHKRHRFDPDAIVSDLNDLGFEIVDRRTHTYGFGVLNRFRINLNLCRKLESMTGTHPNLERLGWTVVLKAKKRS